MSELSDESWRAVAAVGKLPPEAREGVELALHNYRADDGPEYHVSPRTRENLARAKKGLSDLMSHLELLETSRDFRTFNREVGADATALAPHLRNLEILDATLDHAEKRLEKRSRKNWSGTRLHVLFVELLEIRTWHLKIDVPNQVKETTAGGPFHKYLECCLELVEPNMPKVERAKMTKAGIDVAIKSFAIRRVDPIYSWQWDDLFPQSYKALMMSRKYLRG